VKDRARILACLKSIEEFGFDCPRVQFRQIKGSLWEIKIKTQSGGFRIFYVTVHSKTLVLLHAYKKQSQKAPKKEIEIAERRMIEVLNDESYYTK
jgi:phage-related protein